LQKILSDLKVKFQTDNMGNPFWKDGNHVITVQSFYDGKAIVIGANLMDYTGITLEKINKWNDDEALSRAILRSVKDKEGKAITSPAWKPTSMPNWASHPRASTCFSSASTSRWRNSRRR
jgi:hypothetical protein